MSLATSKAPRKTTNAWKNTTKDNKKGGITRLFSYRKPYFSQIPTYFFIGDKDPYFTPDTLEQYQGLVDAIGFDLKVQQFCGTHKVDEKTLGQWVAAHLSNG